MCAEYMVQLICGWPGESICTNITCTDFLELGNSQVLKSIVWSHDWKMIAHLLHALATVSHVSGILTAVHTV